MSNSLLAGIISRTFGTILGMWQMMKTQMVVTETLANLASRIFRRCNGVNPSLLAKADLLVLPYPIFSA